MEIILSNPLLYKPHSLGTYKPVDKVSSYFYLTYTWHCKFGLFKLFHIVGKFPKS